MRCALSFMALLGVLVTSGTVRARPAYPAAIEDAASIPCAPPCTLCHTVSPGTRGTATKVFAFALQRNGLIPDRPETISPAVTQLRAKQVDSDGDGVADVAELATGSDPSDPRAGAELCGPTYGCGARVARTPPSQAASDHWLLALGFAAALLERARRRRSAQRHARS